MNLDKFKCRNPKVRERVEALYADLKSCGKGPCAKQIVVAELYTPHGGHFIGTNWCHNPQQTCPRGDLPSGEGYHLCKEVCQQEFHAETDALNMAAQSAMLTPAGTIELYGHTWVCPSCKEVTEALGVKVLIMEPEGA